jgi:hypothetical protein
LIKTPSIIPEVSYPNPNIKIIFENYENDKYDNARLYQNILEYANSPPIVTSGFRFTELGRWLMKKNNEFINDYSGFKNNTSISARIANKRQRIQNCINNLIKWDFLMVLKNVTAKKNDTETPLYVLTPLGKLIFLIVKAKFSIKEEEKNNAISEIIDIVNSIREQNDSAIVLFITELLNQLWENNKKSSIIRHLERLLMLELNNGNDFLSHLLGIRYFIYWFIVDEELSFKILENLTEDKKKIILVNLKTEIEYYYQQNYLIKDNYCLKNNCQPFIINNLNYGDLIHNGAIPNEYWENTRIKYINSFSKVVVPSYCNVCNSHRVFVVEVADYLKAVVRAHGPYPNLHVAGNCIVCQNSLSTHIIRLPFGSLVWK